jgi:hypothetical protein
MKDWEDIWPWLMLVFIYGTALFGVFVLGWGE